VFRRLKNRSDRLAIEGTAWVQSLLRGELRGIYTHRLIRSAREGFVRSGSEDIVRDLLAESSAGQLAYQNRRWNVDRRPPISGLPSDDEALVNLGNVSPALPRYLQAIPCSVLPGIRQDEPDKSFETSGTTSDGSWTNFRYLLEHYRACLHLGGATRSSQSAERHTEMFHLLHPRSRWWPDQAGPRPIRIGKEDLGGKFLDAVSKRPQEPILLGYPMSVGLLPDEVVIVSPVALVQCRWSLDDVALTIYPSEEAPSLNPDWVGKNRKRREFRATLRRLADISDVDDDELTLRGRETWGDIPGLASTLASFLPNDISRGMEPAQLSQQLDLSQDDVIQNTLGLFLVSDNRYTKGCRADLGTIKSLDEKSLADTAIPLLFGMECAPAQNHKNDVVVSPFEISEDQFLAVKGGLTDRLTVISGPPGTGKSQVVAALMSSAAVLGRSALFASHTHKAIDAVLTRTDSLSEERPFIVRASGKENESAVDFNDAVDALLERLKDSDIRHELDLKLIEMQGLNNSANEVVQLSDHVSHCTVELGKLWVEKAGRERVASESFSVQDGEFSHGSTLFSRLIARFLLIFRRSGGLGPNGNEESLGLLTRTQLDLNIQIAEAAHKKAVAELERHSSANPDLPEVLTKLVADSKELIPLLQTVLDQANEEERSNLTGLYANLGFAKSREQKLETWQNNADLVIRHFPLWASTTLSIPARIPMVPALFDYVIIDEATTANIAEAIPLIARGKHAIIVGDRMQTGMVSDLNPSSEAELWQRSELAGKDIGRYSFSQISLFDLANSSVGANRHILRDHFRCAPDIANFISGTFYDGRLFVRTPLGSLRPPKGFTSGMHWTNVVGPIEPAKKGSRSTAEAKAVAKHVAELLMDNGYQGTVGVVTPFQEQAKLIRNEVERIVGFEQIQRSQLVVGTAHQFQGDARDVILVSLCYGPGMPKGSEWFLSKSRDWLNVAISRARAVCHIFGDQEAAQQSSINHISKLANWLIGDEDRGVTREAVFESPWEKRLYNALAAAGIQAIAQYPLAGRRLDLAVVKDDIQLDVEVDGETYHRDRDGFRKVSDQWRDHVISSLGWKVRRFWVYELRDDMERCVELVRRDLKGG
jgi:very-short-patch-repair endonuclease